MRSCRVLLAFLAAGAGTLSAQQSAPEREVLNILVFQGRRAIELARLRDQEGWLSQEPLYQGLWLRETGAADSVVYDLLPFASAPRRRDGVALAFDVGTGARMWSGLTQTHPVSSALLGTAAQALTSLWGFASSRVSAQRDLLGEGQCPAMRMRLGAEMIHGFGTDGRDNPLDTRAVILYADCQRDIGKSWRITGGFRGYDWRTPGMSDRQDVEAAVSVARVPAGNALRLFGDASWTPHFQRTVLHVERPLGLGTLKLRPLLRIAWGNRLPFGLGFWPGGFDGFPGFRTGEGRGDRELMLGLDAIQPLAGRLSFRTFVAAGRTSNGGPLIPGAPWLLGARAGLNLGTRLGLFRLEYGVATQGHRSLLIRLGRIL
jgi:hypothetical protein